MDYFISDNKIILYLSQDQIDTQSIYRLSVCKIQETRKNPQSDFNHTLIFDLFWTTLKSENVSYPFTATTSKLLLLNDAIYLNYVSIYRCGCLPCMKYEIRIRFLWFFFCFHFAQWKIYVFVCRNSRIEDGENDFPHFHLTHTDLYLCNVEKNEKA